MDIRHFITFKAIVDNGGYTRAAERLGYAQSTVTSHIQSIEQELGIRLFNRLGKKMVLTEAGHALLPHANEMIRIFEETKQIPVSGEEVSGTIVVGAPEFLTTYRLPGILTEYKKKYPQVKLILKSSPYWDSKEELRKGKTDIVFFLDTVKEEEDLHIEHLLFEPMALVFPKDHPLKQNKFEELRFSQEETFLYTENGCSYRTLFEEYLRVQGLNPKNTYEFWSIEAIKKCVMCGIGVSLLPRVTVETELKENQLSGISFNENPVATQLAYHKNKWFSPALTKFVEMVLEHANQWSQEA